MVILVNKLNTTGGPTGTVCLAVSLAVLQGPMEPEGMRGLWLDVPLETYSMYTCRIQLEDMGMSFLTSSHTEPNSGRVSTTMQHTTGT